MPSENNQSDYKAWKVIFSTTNTRKLTYINLHVKNAHTTVPHEMGVVFISSELVYSPPRAPREVTLVMIVMKELPAEKPKSVKFSQQITEVRHEQYAIRTLHCQENATCKISTESVS